ncbi:MAG: Bug family tripartite tricarboxylate transporter substrate binding protein [Alphaproteobacteria bacterium]
MSKAFFGLLAAGCVAAGAAQAQSVEQFYKDKQIRMIVSADAGTDYDIWARMITRYMNQHIPGKPTFVTQNMPGGGQITATNHLFNVAARDGSVIGMIGRNLPNQALAKHPSVKFDPVKFNWLGSPELTNRVCVALDSSGVKTGEDIMNKELIVGGAGAGTAVSMTPTLLKNMLGMKFKLVEGYKSAGDVILAMERGEVQGICQTITAVEKSRPGWMAQGKLRVLFNMERDPVPDVAAPTIYKFVKTDEQRQLLGLFSTSVELGRPVVAPPEVPKDRVAALRNAFDATMKDKGFLAEAKALDLEINPRTGAELDQMVADLMRTPPELSEKLTEMLTR